MDAVLALEPFLFSSGLALMGAVVSTFFPGTGLDTGDRTLVTIILRPELLDEGEPHLTVVESSVLLTSGLEGAFLVPVEGTFLVPVEGALLVPVELEMTFLVVIGLDLGDLLWMMTMEDLTDVVFPMTGLPLGDAALALNGLDLPEVVVVDVRGLFRGEIGLFRGEIGLDLGELMLLLLALFLGEIGRLLLGELMLDVLVLWVEAGLDLGELVLAPLVFRGVDLVVPPLTLRPEVLREETGLDLSAPFVLLPAPLVGTLSPLDTFFPFVLVGVRLDDLLIPTGDTTLLPALTECEVLKLLSSPPPPSLVLIVGRRGEDE